MRIHGQGIGLDSELDWRRGVLGVVFGDWVAGEEVGCYFWGAILCGLREELAVLILEEGAEGREIFGGDGVEEWVVCRHPERKLHS